MYYIVLASCRIEFRVVESHGWRRLAGYSPWGHRVGHDQVTKTHTHAHTHTHYGAFPVAQWFKKTACNAGDLVLIPGLGRSPAAGNGNPFQNSCLENSMDRGVWQATVHGVTELDMIKQLILFLCMYFLNGWYSTHTVLSSAFPT